MHPAPPLLGRIWTPLPSPIGRVAASSQVLSVVQVVCHTPESPQTSQTRTDVCLVKLDGKAQCASPSLTAAACARVPREDIAWLTAIVPEAKASIAKSSRRMLQADSDQAAMFAVVNETKPEYSPLPGPPPNPAPPPVPLLSALIEAERIEAEMSSTGDASKPAGQANRVRER